MKIQEIFQGTFKLNYVYQYHQISIVVIVVLPSHNFMYPHILKICSHRTAFHVMHVLQ